MAGGGGEIDEWLRKMDMGLAGQLDMSMQYNRQNDLLMVEY